MAITIRVIIAALGALMIVGGLVALSVSEVAGGAWGVVVGTVAILAVAFERSRYRSEAAERSAGDPGPGGGEPSIPGAPFRPTDEQFMDPTSGRQLRVYLNPVTGERRYFAEEERGR